MDSVISTLTVERLIAGELDEMENQAVWITEIFQKLELLYAKSTRSQSPVSLEVNTLYTRIIYPLLKSMSAHGGTGMVVDSDNAASSS